MSTTVSNPYSFNIVNNTEFSSSIQVMLPNESQSLFSDSDHTNAAGTAFLQEDIELKIPNRVNVIFVEASAYATSDDKYSFQEGAISITNIENNKKWASQSGSEKFSDLNLTVNKYIGVTPNKIYKLKIDIRAFTEMEPGDSRVSLNIYYSALINQKNPDILDY